MPEDYMVPLQDIKRGPRRIRYFPMPEEPKSEEDYVAVGATGQHDEVVQLI